MGQQQSTGLNGFIESVGGADTFVWMVVFGALILFVGVMAWLNRNAERD